MNIPSENVDWLYFLNVKPAAIIKINKKDKQTQTVLANLTGTPDGIQVDHDVELIYWTNMGEMGEDFDKPDGTIEVCDLNGENRKILIGNGKITTPKQLILDKKNNMLYWCDREGGKIMRSKTDGSKLETLLDYSDGKGSVVNIMDQCVGIALNYTNNKIYWTQKGPSKGNKGRIFRADIKLSGNQGRLNNIELLLDNLPEPIDLEIDQDNHILYWTDRGALPNGNSLNCANIVDSGLLNYEVLCRGFKEAIGLALDKTEKTVYVADLDGAIYQVDLVKKEMNRIYHSGYLTGITF